MSYPPPPPPTTPSPSPSSSDPTPDHDTPPAVGLATAADEGAESKMGSGDEVAQVEEEEEEECGFCLFMKGGGCKDAFVAWEKCVEDAEKRGDDIVDKCAEVTALLKKCMDAHADYYEPVLRAEQAMVEAAADAAASANPEPEEVKRGNDS
ncbi:unnamed protein product [Musa acuminata subsp. malaccensis]|uniref:(wild Malaysian banana) hypothetical protein n=1 Tax=Musa acuminata subsp. malaccensis TaxID=214687 RepID=A0A804J8H3_MUSAM|nr:PREDICTED: uncharacterized protein LOC103985446 [Musa acuminata subsp. malaccensis]CAG1839608.1 unnamed protein product [Musa acuminata subsp. malaccensis]